MKLNCDLGEGLDEIDAALMPHIDMASIACGGHTGDQASMKRAVALAKQHNVTIGAHPSYPDRGNFGRTSIEIPSPELLKTLHSQVQNLVNVADAQGVKVEYIKAHGALYNDAWHNEEIERTLLSLANTFNLDLVLQAKPTTTDQHPAPKTTTVLLEAFADRAYTPLGKLVSRKESHATHATLEQVIEQARNLKFKGGLHCEDGSWLDIQAQTLCVHSDSPNAVAAIESLKTALNKNEIDRNEE